MLALLCCSACKHTPEETAPIQLQVSQTVVTEGDTVELKVIQDEKNVTRIQWNQPDIEATTGGFRWIVPDIEAAQLQLKLIAEYNDRSDEVELLIGKRALLSPLVSYSASIVPILEQNCNFSGCHGQGSRAGRVNLSVYDSTARVVKPFSAPQSLLFVAILRDDPRRWMPPAGKLHTDKVEAIRLWIEQGARNN